MDDQDRPDPPAARRGETPTPPAGLRASLAHYWAKPVARAVMGILLVVLVVLAIALAISMGSTSKEPGPGATGLPRTALAAEAMSLGNL